jgi:mono/diheme cytochrome c family protein
MKTILLILGIFLITIGRADEGEQLFKTTCAACHTIGGGRLVGPDLLGITEKKSQKWLIPFIKSSTSVIKSGDADANAIFKEYNYLLMPDVTYSATQIASIINYISNSGEIATGQDNVVVVDILAGASAKNIQAGIELFAGSRRLANGGASCTSCHKVRDERIFSSGLLAKDLSQSYDLIGSAGLSGIILNPPFPVMAEAYKNHPLTGEEVINLTAYLKSVSEQRIYQRPTDFNAAFAFFGMMAFIMIYVMTIILYFKRKKFPVNREILDRPSKVIN